MVASLYAVITILVTLAEDHDAPKILAKKGKMKVPFPAFLFLAGGLMITNVIGFLMPEKIFEYLVTAAGLMLIYNWLFILVTYMKLMKLSKWEQVKNSLGMLLIAVTVSGTLGEKTSRLGFFREPALYNPNRYCDLDYCEKAKKRSLMYIILLFLKKDI